VTGEDVMRRAMTEVRDRFAGDPPRASASLDGVPRPDHGPGWRERRCADCGAGWVGHVDDGDDWCPWCERAEARQIEHERRMLLDPPWLRSSEGDPRYDRLSEVDKAVWDRTRGQSRGTDSLAAWETRLRRAVESGLVTKDEARTAWRRVTKGLRR
jgi:hypothetical protein